MDELLGPFLAATSAEDVAREMEKLFIDHISPVSREASRRYLRAYGGNDWTDRDEEVQAEVALRLTARLRELRRDSEPIQSLRAYVTSAVFNAACARTRERCPKRSHLQNRIRYLLRNYAQFAMWQSATSGEWLGGLAKWAGCDQAGSVPGVPRAGELADILAVMFHEAGAPLRLSDIVTLAADSLGIRDEAPVPILEDELAAPHISLDSRLVARERLEGLWAEVRQLPERQRAALLLNLRDDQGNGVIELLPAMGVASLRQLAEAAGMAVEGFAAIWNDLPLADSVIGAMLGLTRQQVINLRKSARERLNRRIHVSTGNTVNVSSSNNSEVVRLG